MSFNSSEMTFSVRLDSSVFCSYLLKQIKAEAASNLDISLNDMDSVPDWEGSFLIVDNESSDRFGTLSMKLSSNHQKPIMLTTKESPNQEKINYDDKRISNASSDLNVINLKTLVSDYVIQPEPVVAEKEKPIVQDSSNDGCSSFRLSDVILRNHIQQKSLLKLEATKSSYAERSDSNCNIDVQSAIDSDLSYLFDQTPVLTTDNQAELPQLICNYNQNQTSPSNEVRLQRPLISNDDHCLSEPSDATMASSEFLDLYQNPVFKCHVCDYQTSECKNLKKHFRRNHVASLVGCTMCAYATKFKHNLKVHYIRTHKLELETTHALMENSYNNYFKPKDARKKLSHYSNSRDVFSNPREGSGSSDRMSAGHEESPPEAIGMQMISEDSFVCERISLSPKLEANSAVV